MVSRLTLVTRKGQITIPAEIRRALDIKQGDRVAVTLEDGHARLVRYGSVTERTAGMFKTDRPPLSAEEEREAAAQAWADDALERMGG